MGVPISVLGTTATAGILRSTVLFTVGMTLGTIPITAVGTVSMIPGTTAITGVGIAHGTPVIPDGTAEDTITAAIGRTVEWALAIPTVAV